MLVESPGSLPGVFWDTSQTYQACVQTTVWEPFLTINPQDEVFGVLYLTRETGSRGTEGGGTGRDGFGPYPGVTFFLHFESRFAIRFVRFSMASKMLHLESKMDSKVDSGGVPRGVRNGVPRESIMDSQ